VWSTWRCSSWLPTRRTTVVLSAGDGHAISATVSVDPGLDVLRIQELVDFDIRASRSSLHSCTCIAYRREHWPRGDFPPSRNGGRWHNIVVINTLTMTYSDIRYSLWGDEIRSSRDALPVTAAYAMVRQNESSSRFRYRSCVKPRPHQQQCRSNRQHCRSYDVLRSTLSMQHSTLLPQTATISNEYRKISSFRQSRNKLNMFNLFRLCW